MNKETLNQDLIIIYDADCAMCRWYTGAFVSHGLLPENGREAYQQIGPFTKSKINMNKARNHIALFNKHSGQVIYGYESLAEILGSRWKGLKSLATHRIVAPLIGALYNFISYNRKVIVPSAPRGFLDCIPDRNWAYRISFLILAMLVTEFTAGIYFTHFFAGMTRFNQVLGRESILFTAQLLFQGGILWLLLKKGIYDYLGNLAMVSMLGGIGLLGIGAFVWIIGYFGFSTAVPAAAALGAILMFMFSEHKRRLKMLNLPAVLSWSWVAFRVLLYFIIFR
jgi:hypothetical protein